MSEVYPIAVFDLDGTITRRDTYVLFLIFCLRSKPSRLLKSPMLVVYFFLYKLGIRSNHWLKARFLRLVLGGVGDREVDELARHFCKITIDSNTKNGALDEMQSLREKGYKIVLATASFGFYVKYIAEVLAVDELLCTAAEVDHKGRLTGEINGLNCIGEEKARRVIELQTKKGWPEIQRVYSDDAVDLPLLKLAQTALIVDPKPATVLVAGQFGYQILRWR